MGRQTDRQTGRQTDSDPDRQRGRKGDRLTFLLRAKRIPEVRKPARRW